LAHPDMDRYTQQRSEPLVDKCFVPCDRLLTGSLSLSSPHCQPPFLAKEADLRQSHIAILPMRPLPDEHHGTTACNDTNSCPTLRTGFHRIYLAAPLDAQARAKVQTGLLPRL